MLVAKMAVMRVVTSDEWSVCLLEASRVRSMDDKMADKSVELLVVSKVVVKVDKMVSSSDESSVCLLDG